MKSLATAALLAAALLTGCRAGAQDKTKDEAPKSPAAATANEDEKAFYALGVFLSQRVGSFALTPQELEQVKKGLADGVTGNTGDFQIEPYGSKLQEISQKRAPVVAQRAAAQAQVEKDKSKAFEEAAAKEAGAAKSASGLVFKTLTAGTGASPAPTDTVKVHYKGTLTSGQEFDSSYTRGTPAEFQLNGVIPCWTEGVQKMKVGEKAKLVCPSSIAYGDGGRPPKIPGGATLVFEVELLEVKAKTENKPAAPVAPKS
jgi:FKBP-type peptidyl-prolyl cis-trans isomerase FkpA